MILVIWCSTLSEGIQTIWSCCLYVFFYSHNFIFFGFYFLSVCVWLYAWLILQFMYFYCYVYVFLLYVYVSSSYQLALFSYPDWGFPVLFSSVVRQMPWYNPQRRGTAPILPKCLCCCMYCLFCVILSIVLCVNVYCTTTATCRLTNCS
jgi:hypothetical protein